MGVLEGGGEEFGTESSSNFTRLGSGGRSAASRPEFALAPLTVGRGGEGEGVFEALLPRLTVTALFTVGKEGANLLEFPMGREEADTVEDDAEEAVETDDDITTPP